MKKVTVDVKFTQKGDSRTVKVRVLHNGKYLLEKATLVDNDPNVLYEFTEKLIEKYDATNISMGRGVLEDAFAKYLEKTNQENQPAESEESEVIEGISFDSVSEEGKDLLVDLKSYKSYALDSSKHQMYQAMLFQGVMYNAARKDLYDVENVWANPYELNVDISASEREAILEAIEKFSKDEEAHGFETFKVKKTKRLIEVKKTDYKLTINLVAGSEQN